MARTGHLSRSAECVPARRPCGYIEGVAAAAAEAVVLLHLGYLVYAAFGGFLALRALVWLWPHIVSTIWSVTVTLTPINCPLTALEKWLLQASGQPTYSGSFTAHYMRGVVYPTNLETAVWLSGIGLALASYALVLARRRAVRLAPSPTRAA